MARSHHEVIERSELLDLGYTRSAIAHRLKTGRLFPTEFDAIYAVGRRRLSRRGRWYAAVRACGDRAFLSHGSSAAFWTIGREGRGIEISVVGQSPRRHHGLTVRRRTPAVGDLVVVEDSIRVASPALTVIDQATHLSDDALHGMISEADVQGLVRVAAMREIAAEYSRIPGAARVRDLLDRLTFTMPRSVLERRFRPLADRAGLHGLGGQTRLNGHRVDFFSEDLGLIIETDGNTFHRSPQKQVRDNRRDQDHVIAGHTPLRFSHYEIAFEPEEVVNRLQKVVARLRSK